MRDERSGNSLALSFLMPHTIASVETADCRIYFSLDLKEHARCSVSCTSREGIFVVD